MEKWNNYETLEHYKGKVWISKKLRTKKAGNVCFKHKEEFRVMAYLAPNIFEGSTFDQVIYDTLKAQGFTDSIYEDRE